MCLLLSDSDLLQQAMSDVLLGEIVTKTIVVKGK